MEGIGAAQRGRSRPVGIPGTKEAPALDLANWFGIGQDGGEIQRLAGPDRAEGKALDDKSSGHLTRLVCAQGEYCIGAVQLVDKDAHVPGMTFRLRDFFA